MQPHVSAVPTLSLGGPALKRGHVRLDSLTGALMRFGLQVFRFLGVHFKNILFYLNCFNILMYFTKTKTKTKL